MELGHVLLEGEGRDRGARRLVERRPRALDGRPRPREGRLRVLGDHGQPVRRHGHVAHDGLEVHALGDEVEEPARREEGVGAQVARAPGEAVGGLERALARVPGRADLGEPVPRGDEQALGLAARRGRSRQHEGFIRRLPVPGRDETELDGERARDRDRGGPRYLVAAVAELLEDFAEVARVPGDLVAAREVGGPRLGARRPRHHDDPRGEDEDESEDGGGEPLPGDRERGLRRRRRRGQRPRGDERVLGLLEVARGAQRVLHPVAAGLGGRLPRLVELRDVDLGVGLRRLDRPLHVVET